MGTLAEQNRGRVWGNTVRVIVMARQQAQSSKDNDPGCHVWTVRNVGCALLFGKGQLGHEIGDLCNGGAFLMTKPRTH